MTKAKTKPLAEIQANQWEADPRQLDFLKLYLDPKNSDTYSNVYASAKAAGYSDSYAKVLNHQSGWLSENLKRATKTKLVNKAVNNLDKLLDSTDDKVKADMTKFALKTDPEFSEKTDITTGGDKIQPLLVQFVGDVSIDGKD